MFLRGAQAREARDALGTLSQRFLTLPFPADPSLASGAAGLALVHAAMERAFPGLGHAERSQRALARAIRGLRTYPLSPGLYEGFIGVAWVVEVLRGDPSSAEDPSAAIDDALEAHLEIRPWVKPYDLTGGLVGVGVYALERLPRPSAKRLCALVVSRLAETARGRAPGVAWQSDPEWVPEKWRRTPHPRWNLGVAHGVPGVIALLGRIVAAEVDARTTGKASTLLERAVAWLLAQELPRNAEGCFASATAAGIPRTPARLAWCYGDAGIAATLLVAARCVGSRKWERDALRIALRAAARPHDRTGVVDVGLCHGTSGVAHVFHRVFRATGEKRLADASRFWFARTLAMRVPRRGFAGFRAFVPDAKGEPGWRPDPSFLTGAAGIALALVAATTRDEPVWDRALLLS